MTGIDANKTAINLKFWSPADENNTYEIASNSHARSVLSLKRIDNATLASGSFDGYVKLWNYATSSFKAELHTGSAVRGLELLNNGMLACGLDNGVIQLWDLNSMVLLKNLTSNSNFTVISLTLINSSYLVSGYENGKIRTWKNSSDSLAFDFELNGKSDVNCLKMFPNSNYLASGLANGVIQIWNINAPVRYVHINLTVNSRPLRALESSHRWWRQNCIAFHVACKS